MKYMGGHGIEVLMVSADGANIDNLVKREGCPHVIIPFSRQISPINDLKCLWKLALLLLREKPDIVHTHTPKAGLLGMIAARLTGVPIKIHTIAGLPLMTALGAKRELLVFVEKLTYWAADFVLPNSNSIMSFVIKNSFVNNNKISMIGGGSSNGIDLEIFSSSSIDSEVLQLIKKKIDYEEGNQYILSVGRLVHDKGIIELIESFLALSKLRFNLKLVIVGYIEEERAEERLPARILEEIQINENIIHVGWSNYVPYYMYLANVFVHASHREGFPNVVLQAGAMKLPVICSNIPGNIDIVANGKTGVYFNVKDSSDLQKKLEYALDHPKLMKNFSENLRDQIEEKYDRKFIHKELLKFYQEKLNGRF